MCRNMINLLSKYVNMYTSSFLQEQILFTGRSQFVIRNGSFKYIRIFMGVNCQFTTFVHKRNNIRSNVLKKKKNAETFQP